MTSRLASFVKGKYVTTSSAARTYDLFDAAADTVRASVSMATSQDIDTALDASREAQQQWYHDYSPLQRSKLLLEAANLTLAKTESIAVAETMDTGRPIFETRYEAPGAFDCLQWFAGLAPSIAGQHLDNIDGAGSFGYTRREPLGVTVGIGAWNYPLQSAIWKSAPALAFGNSMVFKPSELTPSTALQLAEIYQEAGIPDGVFQVVLGDGSVGTELVNDVRPNKVSFTGSLATGQKLYQSAASDLKKVTLELGGKSPLVIFEDADVDAAVTGAMMANWYSTGQICSNGTRVFVHEDIMDAFLERLVERTKALQIGPPMDESTQLGPMVSKAHMEKVMGYIQHGKETDQATLLYGGNRMTALGDGYYVEPTIFTNCTDDMKIVQEEIFGMVMTVLPFRTEEEVLARANDTPYGLSAGVFTKDMQRGHRMVANLQAGTTWINNYNLAPVELPWGGFKHSGLGSENGVAGVESWTKMKSVYVEMGTIESPW